MAARYGLGALAAAYAAARLGQAFRDRIPVLLTVALDPGLVSHRFSDLPVVCPHPPASCSGAQNARLVLERGGSFLRNSAAGNLLVAAPAGIRTVADAGGTRWRVDDMQHASALFSLLGMGGFALVSAFRIPHKPMQHAKITNK